jgi:hypothetical protein
MQEYFSKAAGVDLHPVFNQYLRRSALPVFEYRAGTTPGTVDYRWVVEEPGFTMPIKAGLPEAWLVLTPTTTWQTIRWAGPIGTFKVATDLFYVTVKAAASSRP